MGAYALKAEPAILIVEDDPLLGTEIGNVLERLRFKVIGIASTAHEALSLLEVSVPQLALIDTRLEGAITAEELAGAFHRLGIATVFIGAEPNLAARSAELIPSLVATISGALCPSSVFKTICKVIPEDQETC
jgi:DNA-binding NarL/FixJ family response regulator